MPGSEEQGSKEVCQEATDAGSPYRNIFCTFISAIMMTTQEELSSAVRYCGEHHHIGKESETPDETLNPKP